MLEDRHNYIQFLFPIRESGMSSAQPLTKNEAEIFQKNPKMQERIIKSYEIMLDFYGMKLVDKKTGQIERNEKTWKQRYEHLNSSGHNYLRITRILKCLGLVGLEHLKKPWIKHFIIEVFQNNQLENVKNSLIRYWIPTLRRENELIEMEDLVKKLTGKRILRKYYDKEPRTWANQVIPLNSDTKYPEGKTFYNRDDDENSDGDDILQLYDRSRWVWWNTDSSDASDASDGGIDED